MIIFYFLGVGPPCCSILCQFWLCEEAQCVYLRRHLGSPDDSFFCVLRIISEAGVFIKLADLINYMSVRCW